MVWGTGHVSKLALRLQIYLAWLWDWITLYMWSGRWWAVFYVTRKSCSALAELDGGAVVGADSTKLSCDDGFDLVDHSCEKDTRGGRGELSSLVTQKSIDEVQHLTSNIQTRSYPIQRVEALQDTTGPGVIPDFGHFATFDWSCKKWRYCNSSFS